MEPDKPNAKKLNERHTRPAVIIGIRDHKARQPKEEVDREVCVVHQVEGRSEVKWVIKYVKNDDQKCRAPSQAIQHFKMLFSATCPVGADCGFRLINSRGIHDFGVSIFGRFRVHCSSSIGDFSAGSAYVD